MTAGPRLTTLLELLGRPDEAFPVIRLAGGAGKSATGRMIGSLLGALGLSAGTHAAAHVQDVRERVRIAGELIGGDDLHAQLAYLEPFLAEVETRLGGPVTPDEALAVLACSRFADAPVDVAVFETHSGGGADAPGMLHGEVAVVGPVAWDGIGATEAAGSVARGVADASLVVFAQQAPALIDAFRQAGKDSRLLLAGEDFGVASRLPAVGGQLVDLQGVTGLVEQILLPLHGAHQAENAACALAAVEAFLGLRGGLDPDPLREGFAAVRLPAQVEVIRRDEQAAIVLDAASSAAAGAALTRTLREEFSFRHHVVVIGPQTTIELDALIAELRPVADHVVATEVPDALGTRARVVGAVQAGGGTAEVAGDLPEALELADGLATAEDAVVVTGSATAAGAARELLGLDPA